MLYKRAEDLTHELNEVKKSFTSIQHDTKIVDKEIKVLELESKLNNSAD